MKPNLYMSIGLPGSGKSTWGYNNKEKLDFVIHSSDALREELFDNVNEQSKNADLFVELHRRIKNDLRAGKNVYYDSTALSSKRRIAFLRELKSIECRKICVIFVTPYEVCLLRNNSRDRKVPEEVISNMYKNFNIPFFAEGWDEIRTIYDTKELLKYKFSFPWDFKQDNPHHSMTLGNHMHTAFTYLINTKNVNLKAPVAYAAYYHDAGKVFTKSFVNSKGETTDVAHYYNHQNVSAYIALQEMLLWCPENALYVSKLVNDHMKPYLSWKDSPKAKYRDQELLGMEYYNDIMLLHEADLFAH